MTEPTKTYSQMRQDFLTKYQKKIVPKIQYLDGERKQRLFSSIVLVAFFGFCGLACLFLPYTRNTLEFSFGLFSFAFLSWYCNKKQFEKKIKAKIMPIICSCFENLHWSEGFYQDGNLFMRSNLVKTFNREDYDDIFEGSFKGVDFEIIEALYRKGENTKESAVIFAGVIVKLNMNKKFSGHTVIYPDTIGHFSPASHLRHTTLEDIKFEKNFDVYTDDEVEARYLITPSFMERLNDMKTSFKANSVRCAFYNNYLLIGLRTNKDLFSVGSLTKTVDTASQYFQMYEEIISIVKLIDHFKLNQKIGL